MARVALVVAVAALYLACAVGPAGYAFGKSSSSVCEGLLTEYPDGRVVCDGVARSVRGGPVSEEFVALVSSVFRSAADAALAVGRFVIGR